MYTDIGKYYYKKAVKQGDSIKYEVVSPDEETGYIVSVSQIYIGCKSEAEMKLKLVQDLQDEANRIFNEVLDNKDKRLTKTK